MSATSESINFSETHRLRERIASNDLGEEKMLNIPHEECDSVMSSGQRSISATHPLLNRFRQRTLCVGVAAALVISVTSLALAAYAIIKYSQAVEELVRARENRGEAQTYGTFCSYLCLTG